MRILPGLLALGAIGLLAACNSEEACTQELATRKAADLTSRIQDLAASDPTRVASLAPKLQELAASAAAGGDDLSATCKALDEMIAELSK